MMIPKPFSFRSPSSNSMNRRVRAALLLLWAALLHPSALDAQDSLTVAQAVRRALETHPAVAQAIASAGAAEARTRAAASAYYPDVTAAGQYANIGPLVELTIPNMGSFQFYPENNYDAHIAARYTVTDFGRRGAAVDLSRSRARVSRDAVELSRSGVAMATVRAFYAALFLRRSLTVEDEQIEALSGHLDATRKRVAAGTATPFDALTTQVRVAAARSQKVEIENALQKQEAVLRQLLNAPPHGAILIRGGFEETAAVPDADSLFNLARRQRTELAMARDAENAARLQARLSSLGAMPSLRVNLSYGSKNGYIPDLDKMRANWVAAVAAEMPIFDGGRISNQSDEAKAALLAEQAHTQDVERQVRADVEQAESEVRAAQSKIRITGDQLRQAHEAVVMARSRYETGSATNLDVLDAETAESLAKLSNLQAVYRHAVSRYELDRSVGNRFYDGPADRRP
jgi:outer membrane protein